MVGDPTDIAVPRKLQLFSCDTELKFILIFPPVSIMNVGHLYSLSVVGWISNWSFFSYRVIDRVEDWLMDQQVKQTYWSIGWCNETKTFKWNFRSVVYGERRWSIYSWEDVTRFVYGCLFVCDWHSQMVFASLEALMAVVHHSACVSCRGLDKRSLTQVNDQSLQGKWRCVSFESVSLVLK